MMRHIILLSLFASLVACEHLEEPTEVEQQDPSALVQMTVSLSAGGRHQLAEEAKMMESAKHLISTDQSGDAKMESHGHKKEKKDPPEIGVVLFVCLALSCAVLAAYGVLLVSLKKLPEEKAAPIEYASNLAACSAGIIICFVSYGIAQEYIMTQGYGKDHDHFPSVQFLILSNRILILIVSTVMMIVRAEGLPSIAASKWAIFPGASILVSSRCQYEALDYVSFPTQVVFKSGKIVPTMGVNTVVNGVTHGLKDYFSAALITAGVITFSLLVEDGGDAKSQGKYAFGVALLCIFLMCDALTSTSEKKIYTNYPEFTNNQMMFTMGVVALIYSIFDVHWSCGFVVVFEFLDRNHEALAHIFALAICSTTGQWVLQYCIKRHGPVIAAVLMTVRQILSIFVSAAIYDHDIKGSAYVVALLTFGVCLEKPLTKWYQQYMGKSAEAPKDKEKEQSEQPALKTAN
eukprot:gnl/TRDRNA2_/TRDRNA2_175463_c0_seq2.p1 gnl/TRDRNA2_/TRDRNA2_175463_c0~~gnl/TRDRNA2_/TRDRNA2_175463_c0_seq2.p1  ORF type:complete len:461 (+),score=101.70 gnl/TRDRNA2_/TRDRNA2_175463_c0_seq2:91-1473(+)